jgi:hypothetical protein
MEEAIMPIRLPRRSAIGPARSAPKKVYACRGISFLQAVKNRAVSSVLTPADRIDTTKECELVVIPYLDARALRIR